MGNACYYSVEKLLSSSLLSKNLKVRIYKTVILPVVLYGCETWTLALREEHRLRVFENKCLGKYLGLRGMKLQENGESYTTQNCKHSPDIIGNIKSRRLRWAGHVARMGEPRNAYSVLVGKPEGKRPLGRPRRRWEDNIKMDLREVGYDDREWINLAQDRDQWRAYVRAAMNRPAEREEKRREEKRREEKRREEKRREEKRREEKTRYLASEWDERVNAGELSPGSSTESYPAFAHIGLRENPGKNLKQITCPDRESNPGHLVSRPPPLLPYYNTYHYHHHPYHHY
ncbi:hypothetical protein ANN_21083 [Periplaneta americana]|uniref:Endonuclease-reverse transcriptase n=1 Tax=Periplaneta americana TaxID=6978 RepID=A0ABQ8SEE2_PERAM|nr:hypothetical protein ANN_21083 [Periplaneta americana]